MPAPYLDHIIYTLKVNGFTRTLLGPRGGHTLAMNPEDINLSMVMAAFDETETIVGCLANVDVCILSDACTQRSIWQTVEEAVNKILDRTTIADLVQPVISVPAFQREFCFSLHLARSRLHSWPWDPIFGSMIHLSDSDMLRI